MSVPFFGLVETTPFWRGPLFSHTHTHPNLKWACVLIVDGKDCNKLAALLHPHQARSSLVWQATVSDFHNPQNQAKLASDPLQKSSSLNKI